MNRFFTAGTAAAVACALYAPAISFAQDSDGDGYAYGGVNLGYQDLDYTGAVITVVPPPPLATDDFTKSMLVGGFLGYRYDFTNPGLFVAGEAELDFLTSASDLQFGFSGLLGYSFDRFDVFGRIGYSGMDNNVDNQDGLFYGGGVGFKVQPRLNFRLEYRRYDWSGDLYASDSFIGSLAYRF